MRPLSSKWFQGFKGTPDEKKDLELAIRNSTVALSILTRILQSDLQNAQASRDSDYNDGNWSLRQADRMGVARTLTNILSLVDLKGIDH